MAISERVPKVKYPMLALSGKKYYHLSMITKFDENSKMNRLNYVVRFLIFSKKTFSDIWNKNTS